MFAVATVVALFATLVSAVPALSPRQNAAVCSALPSGSVATTTYNFTLAAYNLTLPNANSTGVPLVLGWGPAGTSPAASAWAISTYAEWHSNEWPYFTLTNGALYPNPGPDENGLGAYDFDIASGAEVGFYVTEKESNPTPPEIYCAAEHDGYSLLAVNNNADSFSLCQATTTYANNVLVYEASSDNGDYEYDTCYSVQVNIISYNA